MEGMVCFFSTVLIFLCILQTGWAQNCDLSSILVKQSKTGKVIEGQPEYMVTITNNCKCQQAKVVVKCAGFSSVEPVSPKLLKPLADGQSCYVNQGLAIGPHSSIVFKYAWLTPYDLSPASSTVLCG